MATIAKGRRFELAAEEFIDAAPEHGLDATAIRSRDFVEEDLHPDTAAYFPLDESADGFSPASLTRDIAENTNVANIIYDDQGAYVGTGSTNLWLPDPAPNGWQTASPGATVTTAPMDLLTDGTQGRTILDRADATTTKVFSTLGSTGVGITFGDIVTISTYGRVDSGPNNQFTRMIMSRTTGGVSTTFVSQFDNRPTMKSGGLWKRSWRTTRVDETGTFFPWIELTDKSIGTVEATHPMIEKKRFVTPFTRTSTSAGVLTFNLFADIAAFDWASDYTISYWKRIHGTTTDRVDTGFNVDSIGRNGNTVGGGFRTWGKDTPGFQWVLGSSTQAYNNNDVQYEWLWFVLRREANILTLFIYLSQDNVVTLSTSETTSAPNRYVTQDGYDLQLGGFNLGNSANAYYRDLVVEPSALTNNEIDKLYGTRLKTFENEIVAPLFVEEI